MLCCRQLSVISAAAGKELPSQMGSVKELKTSIVACIVWVLGSRNMVALRYDCHAVHPAHTATHRLPVELGTKLSSRISARLLRAAFATQPSPQQQPQQRRPDVASRRQAATAAAPTAATPAAAAAAAAVDASQAPAAEARAARQAAVGVPVTAAERQQAAAQQVTTGVRASLADALRPVVPTWTHHPHVTTKISCPYSASIAG